MTLHVARSFRNCANGICLTRTGGTSSWVLGIAPRFSLACSATNLAHGWVAMAKYVRSSGCGFWRTPLGYRVSLEMCGGRVFKHSTANGRIPQTGLQGDSGDGRAMKRSMSDHPDSNQGQSDFCADYSQMLDQLSYSRLATRCNVDEITIRTVKTTETQKRTQFVNASFVVRPHSQRDAYPALSSGVDWQQ